MITTDLDHDLTELAFRVAARRPLTESEDSSLPRAVSSPIMLGDFVPVKQDREPLRRTKSYGVIGQALTTSDVKSKESKTPFLVASTQRMRSRGKSNTSLSIGTILNKAIDEVMSPDNEAVLKNVTQDKARNEHERDKSVIRHDSPMMSSNNSSSNTLNDNTTAPPLPQPLERSESTHLDLAAIRGATRCVSRVSTALSSDYNNEDVVEFLQSHRWNHNRSTTPDIVSQRHRRGQSSAVQLHSTIPERLAAATREEVYSPSVYSRPGSADESRPGIPSRLDSALRGPEWPLANTTDGDHERVRGKSKAREPPTSPVLSIRSLHEKPLPPTPESAKSTIKSPPKKTVKKRRSIFRFLRPGSRKGAGRAIRSISSPILLYKSTPVRQSGVFDGPADEITVQYELSENPQQPQHRRSVTVGNVSQGYLSVPQERRGTLIEYERSLSIGGDDRRRRSSEQFNTSSRPSLTTTSASGKTRGQYQDFLEEDEHDEDLLQRAQSSSRLRRKLSRAHALDEAGVTLMGQALKKHQQEKALFRSESKRKESLAQGAVAVAPSSGLVFKEAKWKKGSLPNMTVEEEDETVDPYDQEGPKGDRTVELRLDSLPVTRQPSTRTTSAPGSPAFDTQPPSTPARIGTSLPSWSRFPSHTRDERCGSAGRGDAVSTRDWATEHHVPAMDLDKSPLSKHSTLKSATSSTRRVASNLIKSPSQTFQKVVRYYSDLFTRDVGFHGGNRRTSVSAAQGAVGRPELEMVSPVGGAEHVGGHERAKHRLLRELEEGVFGEEREGKEVGERGPVGKEVDMGWRQGSIFASPGSTKVGGGRGSFLSAKGKGKGMVSEEDDVAPESEEQDAEIMRPDGFGNLDGTLDENGDADAGVFARMYQQTCLPQPQEARKDSGSVGLSRASSGGSGVSGGGGRVRKFPSVTVLDDCKGERASVSLVRGC